MKNPFLPSKWLFYWYIFLLIVLIPFYAVFSIRHSQNKCKGVRLSGKSLDFIKVKGLLLSTPSNSAKVVKSSSYVALMFLAYFRHLFTNRVGHSVKLIYHGSLVKLLYIESLVICKNKIPWSAIRSAINRLKYLTNVKTFKFGNSSEYRS